MRFKATWIVVAVFAALLAYLYFVENPKERAKQEAKEKEGLLFPGFDTAKVTEISLEGTRGKVRAKKGDDGVWVVAEPWDDRADAGRINNLLSDLKALKTFKEVASSDADLKAFGLETPEVTVKTAGSDAVLQVGSDNPAGDARYVRGSGGPVQVAKAPGLTSFLTEPSDLRNKDLLAELPWGRVVSIETRGPQQEAIRLAKSGDAWTIEAPIQAEADPEAAQRLADKLRYARIQAFLKEDEQKAEEKLAQGVSVTLAAQGGEAPVTVRLAEVDGAVWADRTGRKALFTLSKDVLDGFRVAADDLRRKKPILAKPWKLDRVEVTLPGAKLAYEKAGGAWRRGGNALSDSESRALQDFLRDLETGKADRVIDKPGPDSEYGLDKPEIAVTITDTEGKEQGMVASRKGEEAFARSTGPGPVYGMPSGYLKGAEALLKGDEPAKPESEAPPKKPGE